jgi:hypothetical protein
VALSICAGLALAAKPAERVDDSVVQTLPHNSSCVSLFFRQSTARGFQAVFDDRSGDGYRLVQINGYAVGGEVRYAALWDKRSGPARVERHGLTSRELETLIADRSGEGYRLIHISGYAAGGEVRYAAIWEKRAGPVWAERHGLTARRYQQEFDDLNRKGYRLIQVSGYTVAGEDRYAAIWEQLPGPAWQARHGLTTNRFSEESLNLESQGYQLIQMSGYAVSSEARYAAIWHRRSGPPRESRYGLTAHRFQQEFDKLNGKGYRLIQVCGYEVGGAARYAAIWEKTTEEDAP